MRRLTLLVLALSTSTLGADGPLEYAPPKAEGAVVELLEDSIDPLIPLLTNPVGGEAGTAVREDIDVFAGLSALRASQIQKYRDVLPGWGFKIVEKPARAGEFRYLRFAWRKIGGTGIMLQLHDEKQSWCARYVAGPNSVGWGAISVAEQAPAKWTVVTRDLFKDFGELKLTGIAFTPMDGEGGLFDHILLGRTVADLDLATEAALGRKKPASELAIEQRNSYWRELMDKDPVKAGAAFCAFLTHAPDQVAFLRKELAEKPADEQTKKIARWIADLGSDDFDVREAASKGLKLLGIAALPQLASAAITTESAEVSFRLKSLLRFGRIDGATPQAIHSARIARILEKAGTPDAKKLLEEMAKSSFGVIHIDSAKMVLRRSEANR